jgi:hypothetical protein
MGWFSSIFPSIFSSKSTPIIPLPPLPPPVPPIPQVPVKIVPATIANNESSIANNETAIPNKQTTYINSSGEAIYDIASSNVMILVDNAQLKKCMVPANNDLYTQSNCITTYIKGINEQNQILNLTQENQTASPISASGSPLNHEQIQQAMNDNFTAYYNKSLGISKIEFDLQKLQQCFASGGQDDCIVQYGTAFDFENNKGNLISYLKNLTSDAGGILSEEKFELDKKINNCNTYSENTIILILVAIFILVLLIKCQ